MLNETYFLKIHPLFHLGVVDDLAYLMKEREQDITCMRLVGEELVDLAGCCDAALRKVVREWQLVCLGMG